MPLFEVNSRYLQYQSEKETYRFLQDPMSRLSLHIWQTKQAAESAEANEGNHITRFQISLDNNILEWKNNRVNYGEVDSGDDVFGIKKSPVMMMSEIVNIKFIKKIVPMLKENENIAGLKFIIEILEKSG